MGFKHPSAAQRFATTGWQALAGWRKLFFRRWLLVLGVAGVLAGCGSSIDTAEWSEQVKLSDDSIIVVSRKARAKRSGFPNARRGANIDQELRYDAAGVHWKGDFSVSTSPISFDRVDGIFYLVRHAHSIKTCRTKKPDDYAIQIQKWHNGQWMEIPQSETPVDRLRMNLQPSPWGYDRKDDAQGLLTLKGQDGGPPDPNRSTRDDRTSPKTIQAFFERRAIDPRTGQRAKDLSRWTFYLCAYWHREDREWECTSKNGTHSCVRRQPIQK